MGRKAQKLPPIVVVAAIATGAIVTGAAWLTYAVWHSPRRIDLATFGAYAVAVAALVAGLITQAWQFVGKRRAQVDQAQELNQLTDLLAAAVEEQWTRVAAEEGLLEYEPIPVRWRKPSVRIAVPSSSAVNSTRFLPLPGLSAVTLERLESGQIAELHAVYGGLGSGRLLIAGKPGSGKSGAAVLLVLAALRHRREQAADSGRVRVPVPVLFPLHGWDPDTQRVRVWLAERLQQTYPLLSGRSGARKAERLLDAGKLAVILDDLDQMPADTRSVALQALSRQATFRLIILTRSDEMVAAAARGLLASAAAVELQPVAAADAADYLARVQLDPAPTGWSVLVKHLRGNPDGPVAQALSSPLNLTLVRDTYRDEDEIKEFLRFCEAPADQVSREDISDHLLDRVLPAAYARRPGDPPPPYDRQTAEDALRCLAGLMKEHELPELPWWWIRTWAPAAPRIIATGAAFGVRAPAKSVIA